MTAVVLIRHGPTQWNADGRIQGRIDEPLSPAGRAEVATWRLPFACADYGWVTSPLARAQETARLLGADAAAVEPRLAEMDWGAWEGRCLDDLRREFGTAMVDNEAKGLDFRPKGGESPRDVQQRLGPWLAETANHGQPTIAITHNGVIRAALALATGWDMTGKAPVRLQPASAHGFSVSAAGTLQLERPNMALGGP